VLLPDYFGGSNISIAHSNAGSNGIPHATWKKTEGLNTQKQKASLQYVTTEKGVKNIIYATATKTEKIIKSKKFKSIN